jgi:hypothetical protein
MPRDKLTIQHPLKNPDTYNRRLTLGFAKIAVLMLGKLDPPVLAYKNKALAGENRHRKVITQ